MDRRQKNIEEGHLSSKSLQVRKIVVVAHPVSYYVSYFEVFRKFFYIFFSFKIYKYPQPLFQLFSAKPTYPTNPPPVWFTPRPAPPRIQVVDDVTTV